MEFLVQNYSCLQNPWLGGYRLQIPVLSVLRLQLNLLNPPPNKIPGYATEQSYTSTPPYLLIPWCRVLLEKLTGCQLVKKFPKFVEPKYSLQHSQMSATCPSPVPDQCSLHFHTTAWISFLILSSHICLGLPSGLLPSGFSITILYTPPLSPIHATCPTHLILLNLITETIFGEEYRSLSSLLCNFLHSLLPNPS